MADPKVKTEAPAAKAERKKPVRKAPVQKDFPNKLAWLKAMTEFEEKQASADTAARIARLDKRIASAKKVRDEAVTKLTALITERDQLAGIPYEETAAASDPAPTGDES